MVCGASEKTQHGLPSWWGPDHRTVRPPHCLKQYRCCCLAGTAHVALAQPAGPSVPDPWAPPNTDNALHLPMRLCYCQATLPSLKSPISLQFKVSFPSSFRVALGAGRGGAGSDQWHGYGKEQHQGLYGQRVPEPWHLAYIFKWPSFK